MKIFLYSYFSFFFVFSLLLSFPVLFLYQVGEYESLSAVIEKQKKQTKKVMYGTALHTSTHAYKKMLLNISNPKIIALGSSRVMQFRQHMFTKEFKNLGGAMNSINQGYDIAASIVDKKIDVIIIGIDDWFFNEQYQDPLGEYRKINEHEYMLKLSDVKAVIEWLFKGDLPLLDMLKVISNGTPNIGIRGLYKDGFGADGSHYYTRLVTEKRESGDVLFKSLSQRLDSKSGPFQYSAKANKEHIANFVRLIERFEGAGSRVIIFFPPYANAINKKFNSIGEFIRNIKLELNSHHIKLYDYTGAALIGSSDCEFIDGFHGGEITYMRILLDLMKSEASLEGLVDSEFIMHSVNKFSGRAFMPDEDVTSNAEVDFLGLGCTK